MSRISTLKPTWVNQPNLFLICALSLFSILWFLYPQEFIASDPGVYSRRAFEIAQDGNFGAGQIFDQRLTVLLPTAFLYKIVGVNIFTTNLISLFCAILLILVIWGNFPDKKSKGFSLIICLTSIPLFRSSIALYPDLPATAFMALSFLMLLRRHKALQNNKFWWLIPLTAIGALFIAFLAKLTAYWILPVWLGMFIVDVKNYGKGDLFRRFYAPVFVIGMCLLVGYLSFSYLVWEDPLARFHAVQDLSGKHLWSWENNSEKDKFVRLTVEPLLFLIFHYSGLIMFLAFYGMYFASRFIRPWIYYLFFCLLFLWFGTTSFTSYQPLLIVPRMTLPLLPAIYILAAFAASQLADFSTRQSKIVSFLLIIFFILFAGIPFVRYVNSWQYIERAEAEAMLAVIAEVENNPQRDYLLIPSDSRSLGSLPFYFGYQLPENFQIVSVEKLSPQLTQGRRIFIYLNRTRSEYLESEYGTLNYDAEIEALNLPIIYESVDLILFRSAEFNQVDSLIPREGQ